MRWRKESKEISYLWMDGTKIIDDDDEEEEKTSLSFLWKMFLHVFSLIIMMIMLVLDIFCFSKN